LAFFKRFCEMFYVNNVYIMSIKKTLGGLWEIECDDININANLTEYDQGIANFNTDVYIWGNLYLGENYISYVSLMDLSSTCHQYVEDCSGFADDCSGYAVDCSGFVQDCSGFAVDCSGFAVECSGYVQDCSGLKQDCLTYKDEAATSAEEASTSATEAATSATEAATSAAESTTSAAESTTSAAASSASATASAASAVTAAAAAVTATAAAAAAATSASSAASSKSAAASSATAAASSATAAASSATAAASSATAAASSATAAATSATAAATSATNAAISATAAASSVTSAATSASAASTSATSAAGNASSASDSAAAANGYKGSAKSYRDGASDYADNAASSASSASSSASSANSSQTGAGISAGVAGASAGVAGVSAVAAAASASAAAVSATSAGVSAAAAATSETNATASAAGASQSEHNCESYLTLTTEYKNTTYGYMIDVSGKWVEVMNSTNGMGGNITTLQGLTTGFDYNNMLNMTTIDNNLYVVDNLDVGGAFEVLGACTITGVLTLKDDIMLLNSVLLSNAELQYIDGLSTNIQTHITATNGNITTLQNKLTGVSYATDTTTVNNSLVISTGKNLTLTNGNFVVNGVTLSPAELSYLDNSTSNIQTQLNTISGNVSTLQTATTNISYATSTTIIANSLVLSTGKNFTVTNGTIAINTSVINETAIAGLVGYTGSTIASRLTALESSSGTASGALTGISYDSALDTTAVDNHIVIGSTKNLTLTSGNFIVNGVTLSSAELSYLDNVTSNIQTQINSANSNITNLQTATTNILYTTGSTTVNNGLILSTGKNFTVTNGTIAINTSVINETAIAGLVGYTGSSISSRLTALETSSNSLTGITYSSGTDTTTIDNHITISSGKTLTLGGSLISGTTTLTSTELGYLDGLTSNAQTQLTDLQTKTQYITQSGGYTTITGFVNLPPTVIENDQARSATTGSLVIKHTTSYGTGQSCIVFPSKNNYGTDYGYIQYKDDYLSANDERSVLIIGVENDTTTAGDRIALMPSSGYVGVNKLNADVAMDVNGSIRSTLIAYLDSGFSNAGCEISQVISTTTSNYQISATDINRYYFFTNGIYLPDITSLPSGLRITLYNKSTASKWIYAYGGASIIQASTYLLSGFLLTEKSGAELILFDDGTNKYWYKL
jgi:hypothetical protein